MQIKTMLLAATALSVAARAYADGDNTQAIKDALAKLDPKNDDHWTATGEARIDTVKSLTGDNSVNRAAIEKAMPGFNREAAGGENRPGGGQPPAPPAAPEQGGGNTDPMALAQADGWVKHPEADGYHYRGQDVKADAEVAAMYQQGGEQGGQSAPSGGNLKADGSTGPVHDPALDISGQTGMGGAMTARSPEPVEGELRRTHVELESQGEPGERPIGVTQGVTDQGANTLGTPHQPVQNAGRAIELSGEVAARSAGSVTVPSQAPARSSNSETISLGGAADPAVEARAPGGAVVAEGAAPATFFEGPTAGGPFGHSRITAGDGPGQAQLVSVDHGFDGDPDAVAAGEAELEEASARTAELRAQVDDLSAQLQTSLRTEAEIRRRIEANRPRSGNMATIQSFLQAQQERRAQAAREAREAKK